MGSSQRRVFVIVGLSIAVHGVIAVWALLGDPPVERPVWAATTGRTFVPDDVVADLTFDASQPVPLPAPAVARPAPAPAPVHAPVAAAPAPAHVRAHHDPSRLAEPAPSPESLVDGLFAEQRAPLAHRRPASDLAAEADAARRHDHAAEIGNGDPRTRGDDRARPGTAPDCACDPSIAPHAPAPTPPPDVAPPRIHVEPPRGQPPTTLSGDDVLDIITSKYMAGLERCQTQLLRRDGDARGRVSLELTIDDGGATSAAAADGVDPELDRCIEARAAGWHFPIPHDAKTGAAISATFRLSLAVQGR
jgi:hypothetical protein